MGKTMRWRTTQGLVVAFLVAVLLVAAPVTALSAGVQECLDCHDDVVEAPVYQRSAHGGLVCTGCHREIDDLAKHEDGEIAIQEVECAGCHRETAAEVASGVHGLEGVGCVDCHRNIHQASKRMTKQNAVEVCSDCHDDDYAESVHGVALLQRGNSDAPGCVDCHGAHEIEELGAEERRILTVESCEPCHADEEMMARNALSAEAVVTYEHSYHGKVYVLGYLEKVAGCVDCHGAHNVFETDDSRSLVHEDNLAATCGVENCHPGVNKRFTLYASHASHDPKKFPIFFATFLIMSCLLIGVFAFFWTHCLLWWQRAFREKREKRAKEETHEVHHPDLDGEVYRRFDIFGILVHLAMAVSFIGLVFTGMPLKFPHASWARPIIEFFGGAHPAGQIHRICALITFAYFFAVNIRVFYFLLFKKTGQGFWKKFFGPESLFPNLDDVSALTGMFKWFFNRGPKPEFGRWTYWEKFDFLAVYWGMFAIGLTGLMLWFPKFFAAFLPGWLFNVATIMHSDEALLAAGFIFTVHFFNTHWRPEKFPFDPVIFTGKVSRHEMIEERILQIPVEKAKGTLSGMKTSYAKNWYEFVSQLVGYAALALGVAGIYMMITGLFS